MTNHQSPCSVEAPGPTSTPAMASQAAQSQIAQMAALIEAQSQLIGRQTTQLLTLDLQLTGLRAQLVAVQDRLAASMSSKPTDSVAGA